jgi:hypothetical protein
MTIDIGITKPTPGRHTMGTDMKWYAIVMIVIIGTPMAGLALKEYQNSQCRIEAIRANMDVDKIAQVCK